MAWEGDTLVVTLDERTAGLGGSLRGTVRLTPRTLFQSPLHLDPHQRHMWWAVAPLSDIEVRMEEPDLRFCGSGYHDTNFGREPLERGFSTWNWSRAELTEGTTVLYDAAPRVGPPRRQGLLFGADGSVRPVDAPQAQVLPRTSWGIDRSTRSDAGASSSVRRTLENTPFYSRSLLDTTLGGQRVVSMHESLSLDRFEHPIVQRLLPFRIRRGWRA